MAGETCICIGRAKNKTNEIVQNADTNAVFEHGFFFVRHRPRLKISASFSSRLKIYTLICPYFSVVEVESLTQSQINLFGKCLVPFLQEIKTVERSREQYIGAILIISQSQQI